MTTRIDAAVLIPGRGNPVENGSFVMDREQLREGYDADIIALDFNPLDDSSGWGVSDGVTQGWKLGANVKTPT